MLYLSGKYIVNVKKNGKIVRKYETKNTIVNNGLGLVADWLSFNAFKDNYFPCLKQINTTGMTITSNGFSNPNNAVDGDANTYTTCVVDSSSWDNDWWKIDFGENKKIMAVYWDCYEDDSNYGGDYKLQYSSDDTNWTDFPVKLRPPQDGSRSKCLFFVNESPPFSVQEARYIRLNTKRYNDNENFYLYEIKFYEANFIVQPPMIMALGTGNSETTENQNGLVTEIIRKKVNNITKPSDKIVRFIMSLDTDEGNNSNFAEVGLFYNSSSAYELQTTSNADKMFSRALFENVWSKNDTETVDIYYELSVSNVAFESSSSSSSSSSLISNSSSSSSSSG